MSVTPTVSVEQMCRDLLSAATHVDRSVRTRPPRAGYNPDPQARSAGELVAMTNLLTKLLAGYTVAQIEAAARPGDIRR